MLNIKVSTLVLGESSDKPVFPEVRLKLVSHRVTAGEIISKAVSEQWNVLMKQKADQENILKRMRKQYLTQEEIDTQVEKGKIAVEKPKIPVQMQGLDYEISRVTNAFERGSFKIFVDGNEVDNINEMCTLTDGSKIKFIRLVPLVGG